MAKKISTKKPLSGNRRSHALNATKHAQKPNFQKVTINGEKVVLTAYLYTPDMPERIIVSHTIDIINTSQMG